MTQAKKNGPAGGGAETCKTTIAERRAAGVTAADTASVPVRREIVADRIPMALRRLPRWVVWRYERLPNGKLTKVPCSPATGRAMDATKVAKGVAFADALTTLAKFPKMAGVGFILGGGIGGVDVDDCIIDGAMDERGQRISTMFAATYAEVSPSGTGFKAFMLIGDDAELAAVHYNKDDLELYGSKRFFTVTSQRLEGHTPRVARMAGTFRALAVEVGALRPAKQIERDDGQHASGRWAHFKPGITLDQVREALRLISADCSNKQWFDRGRAIELQFGAEGFEVWVEWGATSDTKFPGREACAKEWARYKRNNDALSEHDVPFTVLEIISNAPKPSRSTSTNHDEFILTKGSDLMKNDVDLTFRTALGVACPVGVVMNAGLGGHGKTTVAATFASCVTNGVPCPPWESKSAKRKPAGVLWLTTEEDRDSIVLPRHAALGGNTDLLFVPTIRTEQGDDGRPRAIGFEIDRHLPSMLRQAREAGTPITMVVADALPALVNWEGRSPNSDADVKQLIADLTAIAMEFDCCIFGIAHFNKKADMADEYRMSGAQAWRESPRLSFICDSGHIYVNKTNDLREVGCTFAQEVVKVLYEVDAETEDGKPIQVAARRAVFGPHLLVKADVLHLLGVAKAAAKAATRDADREHKPPARIDAMAAIVRDLFDVLGDGVPAATIWRAVREGHGEPNGAEKKQVAERLGIEPRKAGRATAYYLLPRAI